MNLPNLLTIIRLFLAPIFIFVYSLDESLLVRVIAAMIFLIASVTDVLDGYIARKHNLITDFGKLADPIADKLMQISAIGCLAFDNRISLWILALFVLKEVVMILGGMNLLKNKFVVQSKRSGKIATVLLFLTVIVITVTDDSILTTKQATTLMSVSIIATIIAFFDYAKMYIRVKENMVKNREYKEKQ